MPCGTTHKYIDCNGFYFGCSHLSKMTDDEYREHVKLIEEDEKN